MEASSTRLLQFCPRLGKSVAGSRIIGPVLAGADSSPPKQGKADYRKFQEFKIDCRKNC